MEKVLHMCLVHDFGEAVTGDIPSFLKSGEDEADEENAVYDMLAVLPPEKCDELRALFTEMNALRTPEARLYKALDKMEAVLQHNESPLDTWIPLEYELQLTYGVEEAEAFPYLKSLRAQLQDDTRSKTQEK